MFTGIITHEGLFRGFRKGRAELALETPGLVGRVEIGDSVAVDGVCLTVIRKDARQVFFNLSRETLDRSTLGALRAGRVVNLELPLTLAAPLGGHLVSGHIDFTAKLLKSMSRKPGWRMEFSLSPEFRPYFIPKGSAAVNGVSLTVAALGPSSFEVEIIPVTLEKTNLGRLKPGDAANIECDMVGKYVYNFLSSRIKED